MKTIVSFVIKKLIKWIKSIKLYFVCTLHIKIKTNLFVELIEIWLMSEFYVFCNAFELMILAFKYNFGIIDSRLS